MKCMCWRFSTAIPLAHPLHKTHISVFVQLLKSDVALSLPLSLIAIRYYVMRNRLLTVCAGFLLLSCHFEKNAGKAATEKMEEESVDSCKCDVTVGATGDGRRRAHIMFRRGDNPKLPLYDGHIDTNGNREWCPVKIVNEWKITGELSCN